MSTDSSPVENCDLSLAFEFETQKRVWLTARFNLFLSSMFISIISHLPAGVFYCFYKLDKLLHYSGLFSLHN